MQDEGAGSYLHLRTLYDHGYTAFANGSRLARRAPPRGGVSDGHASLACGMIHADVSGER